MHIYAISRKSIFLAVVFTLIFLYLTYMVISMSLNTEGAYRTVNFQKMSDSSDGYFYLKSGNAFYISLYHDKTGKDTVRYLGEYKKEDGAYLIKGVGTNIQFTHHIAKIKFIIHKDEASLGMLDGLRVFWPPTADRIRAAMIAMEDER